MYRLHKDKTRSILIILASSKTFSSNFSGRKNVAVLISQIEYGGPEQFPTSFTLLGTPALIGIQHYAQDPRNGRFRELLGASCKL